MQNKNGFTLIELSVVLVILALITGGILGGTALINAAELRSITTQQKEWETAMNAFDMRYGKLPGDLDNATEYWGQMASCPPADYPVGSPPAVTQETCDGNGNGRLGDELITTASSNYEQMLFWQQLGNTGLIGGQYNGRTMSGSSARRNHDVGNNCPASSYGQGLCWGVMYMWPDGSGSTAHGVYFPNDGGHMFMLGRTSVTSNAPHWPNGAGIIPADAWSVDKKVDDGKPDTGAVRSNVTLANCYETVSGQREYAVATESEECILLFLL